MPAEELLMHLKNMLLVVQKADYLVVSIITDGNRINNKLFKLLSGIAHKNELPLFIPYVVGSTRKIFLLFDSVHILKCVRNNWINLKNYRKTLIFPEIDSLGNMVQASFVDLEVIHNLEMSKILKKALQLTWKALHPHSLERQNV